MNIDNIIAIAKLGTDIDEKTETAIRMAAGLETAGIDVVNRATNMQVVAAPRVRQLKVKTKGSVVDRLKLHMEEHQLSASRVAREIGTSPSAVYGWFSGKWKPSAQVEAKIKRFLNDESNIN